MGESKELKERTKSFAVEIMRMVESLPREMSAGVLAKQILRAGTSIGANYRAACRSRSASEFIAKMHIVQEEADESQYWLDLLYESRKIDTQTFSRLMKEARNLRRFSQLQKKRPGGTSDVNTLKGLSFF